MAWTPHELPFLRDKTIAVLDDVAALWGAASHPDSEAHLDAIAMLQDHYGRAQLTWFDSDVSQLVGDTMGDVPAWSPAACMPGDVGLVAFEESPASMTWTGHVTEDWVDVAVDAVSWAVTGPGTVRVRALSRLEGARDGLSPVRQGLPLEEVIAVTVARDGVVGDDVDITVRRDPEFRGPLADGKRLLALVGTVWLLMAQPQVVEEGPAVISQVRNRRRATLTAPRRVPVRVSTRRLSAHAAGGGGGGRGAATSRWWVRGHWRQQPWGKNRELRKPIFIAPHTAGARDVEVDDTPQVQVWRE